MATTAKELARRPQFSDQEIKAAFQTLDVDGNGFISATELRVVLDSCGKDVSDQEIDQMMKMVDNDGDGQLSFAEFALTIRTRIMGLEAGQAELEADTSRAEPPKVSSLDKMKARIKKKGEVFEFVSTLALDLSQLEDIYFQKVMRLPDRFVQFEQFCNLMGAPTNSRISRNAFTAYDNSLEDVVDARLLIMALSSVMPVSQRRKAKFSFRLFDHEQTGKIPKEGIIDILKANHLTDKAEEVEKKADLIITAAANSDDPNIIPFDNFVQVIKRFPNIVFPAFRMN